MGLKKESTTIFVQVAYPILPGKKEYNIFLSDSDSDCEGCTVARSDLISLESEYYDVSLVSMAQAGSSTSILVESAGLDTEIAVNKTESGRLHVKRSKSKFSQSRPDPEQGCIWMEQVDADYKILDNLNKQCRADPELKLCATVCYLAQQVAEKAMTGGIIYCCGDKAELYRHSLINRFYALRESVDDVDRSRLESAAKELEDFYLKTRYPNVWPKGTVPADKYDQNTAAEAFNNADCVRKIIQTNNYGQAY